MSGVATAVGGSAVLGFLGSQNASNAQSSAEGAANALSQEQLNYQKSIEAPYQAAGTQALTQMQDPRFQQNFNMSDFTTSPGYQFSLTQGQNALNAANAATGNSVSGAGMAALSNYNVGTADQEYQQAFNNYQNQLQSQYNRLGTIAQMGAGANGVAAAASNNYANNVGSNMVGLGNAQAGNAINQGNILGGGLSGVVGALNAPSATPAGGQSLSSFASSPSSTLQPMASPFGTIGLAN